MNNNQRLYLNSVDTVEDSGYDGLFLFDLSKADLHAPAGSRLKIKCVRAELPSSACIASFNANDQADDFNLKLQFEYRIGAAAPTTHSFTFNPQVALSANTKIWNLATTINDVLGFINDEIGGTPASPKIVLDEVLSDIGLNRLILTTVGDSLTFLTGTSSIEILRGLGCNVESNTNISDSQPTPRNFDLTQVLPNILINSSLNFDSFTSTAVSQTNILDCVPTALTQSASYNSLLSTIVASGSTSILASYKQQSSLIYESTQSGKTIGNTSIDNLTIELLSPQDKKVSLANNNMTLVLEVEYVV